MLESHKFRILYAIQCTLLSFKQDGFSLKQQLLWYLVLKTCFKFLDLALILHLIFTNEKD